MSKFSKNLAIMKSMLLPSSNVKKVFNQLGQNKDGVPYHLHLLNLYFGGEETEKKLTIEKYKNLAISLKDSPEIISELIREVNWRPTLVGNVLAILLREQRVLKDMIWRIENGSWVAPQLAVGIALLDDGLGEKELKRIIENSTAESNPKTVMSAYSSLKFLESEFANEFEKTELFSNLKEKDAWDNSIDIAEKHWDFWKNIEPLK